MRAHTRLLIVLLVGVLTGSAVLTLPSSAAVRPGARKAATLTCPKSARPFTPTKARIPVLGKRDHRVVRVPRENGAIGTPPVTEAGKSMVGWDRAVRPGAKRGTVVIDAHTWPDGSALGNAMLNKLRKGDRLRLSSAKHAVCYRIVSRTSYPRDRIPLAKIFRTGGAPRVVIFVCSGKRLGPGNWLRRTVWIGEVVTGKSR